ncbi:MAG TPA: SRPBCC family protein [Candidatus Udaeobacter sp.]|nr:SRPBCC family protein [Candidatus Udaeobacter sp.]
MASIREEIVTSAAPRAVWDAVRDVGALHTRLVPGFVVNTRLEPNARARVVTFGNGMVIREPIVTVDDGGRRVVWSAEGGQLTHYNGAVQVFPEGAGSRVVWIADFLPDEAASTVGAMIMQGMTVMKHTLDRLTPKDRGAVPEHDPA